MEFAFRGVLLFGSSRNISQRAKRMQRTWKSSVNKHARPCAPQESLKKLLPHAQNETHQPKGSWYLAWEFRWPPLTGFWRKIRSGTCGKAGDARRYNGAGGWTDETTPPTFGLPGQVQISNDFYNGRNISQLEWFQRRTGYLLPRKIRSRSPGVEEKI